MAEIDICLVLGRHSHDYYPILRKSADFLASGKHKLNWKSLLSPGIPKIDKLQVIFQKDVDDVKNYAAMHCLLVNKSIKLLKAEFFLFSHVDIIITMKNWDDFLINHINTHKLDLFGPATPPCLRNLYQNFPVPIFLAGRSEFIKRVNPDFSPLVSTNMNIMEKQIDSHEDSYYYGLNIGEILKQDGGWDYPRACKKAGVKYDVMKTIIPMDDEQKLEYDSKYHELINNMKRRIFPDRTVYKHGAMNEYHYNDQFIATHLGHSISRPYGCIDTTIWVNAANKYLNKTFGFSL